MAESPRMDLIEAVRQDRLDVIKNLCDQQGDANVDYKDEDGRTVLMWAVNRERIGIFNELCKRGANLDIKDNDGRTALMWATACEDPQFVNLLCDRGANVNLRDCDGRTALWFASRTLFGLETIEELCRRGAKVFSTTSNSAIIQILFTKQRFNHKVLLLLRGRKLPVDLVRKVHEWV